MTDRTLKGLYPRFRPPERFRLYVEAAARDDWDEAGRLWGSCPTYLCSAPERAYTRRLLAAAYIAFSAAILLLRAEIALARPTFERELLEEMQGLTAEFESACGDGTTIETAGGDWPEIERHEVDELYRERVASVLGVCEGIERFCDPLGFEPAKLLAVEPSCLPAWHSAVRLRDKDIAFDPATAEAVHTLLEGIWSERVGDQESELQGFIEV
jgi:hypothetical protein